MTINKVGRLPLADETCPMWLSRIGMKNVVPGKLFVQFNSKHYIDCNAVKYDEPVGSPPHGGLPTDPLRVSHNIYAVTRLTEDMLRIKKRLKLAWREKGSSVDWYISCWSPAVIPAEAKAGHPYGHMLVMSLWDHAESIDKHEAKKYTRELIQFVPNENLDWRLPYVEA